MPIEFLKDEKQFHIYNNTISYIIRVLENGQLENLYYGCRLPEGKSYVYLHQEKGRSLSALCTDGPNEISLQYTKQEYPSFGGGDFRYTACKIKQANGSHISEYKYKEHFIFNGKKEIKPLPATYVENDCEATTIQIVLHDSLVKANLVLTYTIYEGLPVIARNARFENHGEISIVIENAMSGCVDLPDSDYEMVHLSGAWARERHIKVRPLIEGVQSIYSMRGASSAEHNPFIALKRRSTTEITGEVYGFSLVYSGSYSGQVEVCSHETTRVLMGIHPDTFSWELNKDESFQTPELIMVYTKNGLNDMSHAFHNLYGKRLARGVWRDRERPILLNNWEATHMDFTEASILELAKKAKSVGVELFVLDDGWFGKRDNDRAGLGDWFANKEKMPSGIEEFSRKIVKIGMKFGLWIEPEMINKDSDLYRNHPDYILETPGRFSSPSRWQFVLDFSRNEVVDAIYGMLEKIISNSEISYIKWDMNRYITECYSITHGSNEQGKVMHEYILGVYNLYDRLTTKFPEILFESCASGGARFDPGMLYFAPQTWCSDDTDAGERIKIQYGTSMVYPISSIGAHVSASPNHKLKRQISIWGRANVAFYGAFGYELDLNELSDDDLEHIRQQIAYYSKYRRIFQFGDFYRIKSPFEGNEASWISVSQDKTLAVAAFYQQMNKVNAGYLNIKFTGLCEDYNYTTEYFGHKEIFTGAQLMYAGINVDRKELNKDDGDFASVLITMTKC